MKISIIIATYNSAKTLKFCLDSIVPQLNNDTELIIIDGASKDNTVEIIKQYTDKLAYFISEPDKGVYEAWNKGVKQARGKWITFIGSDDELLPNAITTYKKFFETHGEEYDLICGKLHFVNANGETIREVGEPWSWKKLIHRKWNLAHPGMLHNRNLFNTIGYFDTRYKICADSDFLQRIGPNIKTGFINEFLINMAEGGLSDSTKALKEGYLIRKRNKTLGHFDNLTGYYAIYLRMKLSKLKRKFIK